MRGARIYLCVGGSPHSAIHGRSQASTSPHRPLTLKAVALERLVSLRVLGKLGQRVRGRRTFCATKERHGESALRVCGKAWWIRYVGVGIVLTLGTRKMPCTGKEEKKRSCKKGKKWRAGTYVCYCWEKGLVEDGERKRAADLSLGAAGPGVVGGVSCPREAQDWLELPR